MIRFIVDSSVVIKWSVPEVHSTDALRYLDPSLERHAPELLLAELSNILWKKVGFSLDLVGRGWPLNFKSNHHIR